MSSTTVCDQELQPCVEALVKLQLVPAKQKEVVNIPETQEVRETSDKTVVTIPETQEVGETSDRTSWSFLQAFTTVIQNPKTETETEEVYVHPLDKRSDLVLSPKSLEMCTENLGSETGCDESSDDMPFPLLQNNDIPFLSLEAAKTPTFSDSEESSVETTRLSESSVPSPKRLVRRVNGGNNFPPPLSSISGSSGVQFLPRREGGRLVMKAVYVTSPVHYFEAERGDGRLRLRLLVDMSLNSEEVDGDEEEEDEAVEDNEVVEEMMEVETKTCREEEEEAMGVELEENSGGHWETEEEEWKEMMEWRRSSLVGARKTGVTTTCS